MYSHEYFRNIHFRMDIIFAHPRVLKQDRTFLFSYLEKISLINAFANDIKLDGAYIEFSEHGDLYHKELTEENIGMLEVLFAEENEIDKILFYIPNPHDGQDYPVCIQYYDPTINCIVKKPHIQAITISKKLSQVDICRLPSLQEKLRMIMMSAYQGLNGISANLGFHGISSYSIDNCFEKYSSAGKCNFETVRINTRGAFWCMVLNPLQIRTLGGIDSIKSAVDFASIESLYLPVPNPTNPYLVDFTECAVCALSDRVDECPFDKLKKLYKFFQTKNLVPDTARLLDASQEDANFLHLLNADV